MPRISLIDEKERPELAGLIEKIRSGRRGNLLKLYRVLLHSPSLAESWFGHNNAVRWRTRIGGRLREMVIIRIAILNQAQYIITQHVPKLAAAEGLSEAECDALVDWQNSDLFGEAERAVLAYADAMTRDVRVSDEVYAQVRRHFDERQTVELTVLIGTYNMQSRVIQALQLEPESDRR
ncbi:MAG TPA: carboxymuconolactone decarboxylase family protein [Xanthobacteraceae bacterium]|jgi:4-carboxymuconolactone decarboxylase